VHCIGIGTERHPVPKPRSTAFTRPPESFSRVPAQPSQPCPHERRKEAFASVAVALRQFREVSVDALDASYLQATPLPDAHDALEQSAVMHQLSPGRSRTIVPSFGDGNQMSHVRQSTYMSPTLAALQLSPRRLRPTRHEQPFSPPSLAEAKRTVGRSSPFCLFKTPYDSVHQVLSPCPTSSNGTPSQTRPICSDTKRLLFLA